MSEGFLIQRINNYTNCEHFLKTMSYTSYPKQSFESFNI